MKSLSLPIAYHVSHNASQRFAEEFQRGWKAVLILWRRWMQRREEDSALQTLAGLDGRTLEDIGMPEEFRSRAAALREASNARMTELMR